LRYIEFLEGRRVSYEIWVILNGCSDSTFEQVEAVRKCHPQVGWAVLAEAGKGRAVKVGLQLARGELIGFVDADGQIAPHEFGKLLDKLAGDPLVDGVIASKYAECSKQMPLLRRLAGRAFSALVRLLLKLPFADTQCGAKLFHRQAIGEVLSELQLEGWTFDVELLLYLHGRGRKICEIPIILRPEERPSKLSFIRSAPRMLLEIIRLRWKVGRGQPAVEEAGSLSRLPQA